MKEVILPYTVPYADTDQMSVVYYANYFVYFERLRNELIRSSGRSYREIEASGLRFPVIEAHCEYFKSALYDDRIEIRGRVAVVEGGRFRVDYRVMRGEEVLVTGHTWHLCISHEGRPRRLPPDILKLAAEQA